MVRGLLPSGCNSSIPKVDSAGKINLVAFGSEGGSSGEPSFSGLSS